MKKILLLIFVFLNSMLFAKSVVAVSIVPQKTFVQKIAHDKANIVLMVEAGSSPHSYEPKSSQMIALSKADIYFSIGVEFEHAWLDKFKSQNQTMKFIDITEGIEKIKMSKHNHHDAHHEEHGHEHHDEHEHDHHGGDDPHVWTSPENVGIIAQNIYKALAESDPKNQKFYKSNLDSFLKEIKETDRAIKDALMDVEPKAKFMVFHPSWGYFANEYKLTQIAVEVEGKSPKPKEMITIIKEAREENVRVIFTQPEFSDKSAKIIAKEAGVNVVKISPLNAQWSQNLINMAKEIANR